MVATIIEILNARLELTGFFHTLYCLTEKKRESRGDEGDFVFPAQYTGSGELRMIEFDSAGFAYFRKDGNGTQSIIENTLNQRQLFEVNIPLRLVAMVRRSDVGGDDAFSPDVLARQIATQLTFKNGDLKTALQAAKTQVNTSSWSTDPEQIWSDETEGTGRIEPDYSRAFIAMTVNVTVTADENCIQNGCEADTDILHLFDFCKASVRARLTDEQVECLEDALCIPPTLCELITPATAQQIVDCLSEVQETAVQALVCEVPPTLCEQLALVAPVDVVADVFDCLTEAAQTELLDSECVIPPCADATVTQNGAIPLGNVASGANFPLITLLDGVAANGTYDSGTNTLSFTSATGWIRNPDWPAMPTPSVEQFIGLLAVFENRTNRITMTVNGVSLVDYGDGTTVNSNGTAQLKTYDYATLAGTAYVDPVTGENYKMVLVSITRIAANITDITFTGGIQNWLDIYAALPNATNLNFVLTNNRALYLCQRVRILTISAAYNTPDRLVLGSYGLAVFEFPFASVGNWSNLLSNTGPIHNLGNITGTAASITSMLSGSLTNHIGTITNNTAANWSFMLDGMLLLESVVALVSSSCTNCTVTLRNCRRLRGNVTVNMPLLQNAAGMFQNCSLLESVIFTNASAITTTGNLFDTCYYLGYLEMNGCTRGVNLTNSNIGFFGMNVFANSLGTAVASQFIVATGTPFSVLITAGDPAAIAVRGIILGKGFGYTN